MSGAWGHQHARFSVRARILAVLLVVTALGMSLAGGTAYLVQRDRILRHIDDRLLSRVDSARAIIRDGGLGAFGSAEDALRSVIAHVVPDRNESSLGIVDGRPTYLPGVVVDFALEDDPAFVQRVVTEVGDGEVRLGTAVGEVGTLRYLAAPIVLRPGADPVIYVVAIRVDAELGELGEAFTTYALVSAASLFAIGGVGWLVAGRLLGPLRRLREAAAGITASDRTARIPVSGNDDLSELTRTVNDMLDRLDEAMTTQHQLLDDVRHELKTPITIVRGHLELLDPRNPSDVTATRALAIDELDRMVGLVDDIAALAEHRTTAPAFRDVDVAALTAEVLAKAGGLSGHDWRAGPVAAAVVHGDPDRITQAWLQLADNAAKYSPSGSPVTIGSTVAGGAVQLWVEDAGPGIPAEVQDRIFERFGRIDQGRGVSGSGLGLAIVTAIAQAHGGSVDLVSSASGSRFSLVLPTGEGGGTA
ncbi:MAG TPA: HAMP domain-containing sensor histidine kinase [Rhodoglobus sp.]|nr:HAMP domain-containing sensor histidine kinase [Rhodoglobus sp.]